MNYLLGKEEVQALLPHRAPILLIDKVWEYEPEKHILTSRWLDEGDPVFQGHFPGFPIMPGVLLLEACAQSAALLLELDHQRMPGDREDENEEQLGVLGSAKVRFLKPVLPKTEIWICGDVEWIKGNTLSLKVEVSDPENLFMSGSLVVTKTNRSLLLQTKVRDESVSTTI